MRGVHAPSQGMQSIIHGCRHRQCLALMTLLLLRSIAVFWLLRHADVLLCMHTPGLLLPLLPSQEVLSQA